jgi:AbrB family looped-hinge helix DNA binding protein
MNASAKLSSKNQVTIPAKACKVLGLKAGRTFQVVVKEDRIELIPDEPISALRGMIKGYSSRLERDDDRF